MKLIRILPLCALSLGAFGLVPQARADWDDHSRWWHHHHHPHAIIVVHPGPVIVEHDDYAPGYHHSIAADVQAALRHRGYYHGPIDGDIGGGSRAAIRAYQYDHDLPVTGDLDRPLLRSLGL